MLRSSLLLLVVATVACHDKGSQRDQPDGACGDCTGADLAAPVNPQPDLVVTALDWDQDPATDYTVRFHATVQNMGTAATPAGTVLKLTFAVDGTLHSWSDTTTSSIAPGDSATLTANAAAGASVLYTPDGYPHKVVATVDDGNLIAESDETNNTFGVPLGGVDKIASDFDFMTGLTTAAIPPDNTGDPVGAFRFICAPSHYAWADPIVYPGQPALSHLHLFVGNDMADAFSTYESLRTTGGSSCGGPVNRSAYWTPAMMTSTGKVVRPDLVENYYKRFPLGSPDCAVQGLDCRPMPRGLKFVFGYNFKTGVQDPNTAWFDCTGPGAVSGHYPNIIMAAANCGTDPSAQLIGRLVAPNCWDGARLDSPDHRSHLVYCDYSSGDGMCECPKTHPFVIPGFTFIAMYTVDSDLDRSGTYTPGVTQTWYLASDHMGMTQIPGETLHSDWFGAWDDDVMKMWEDGCIDSHLNCSGGNLGNGYAIQGASQPYPDSWISIPHQVDPPPHP